MELFGIDLSGIVNIVLSAGIGAIAVMFLDKAYKMVILKFFPSKFLTDWVKKIDDKYLDKFKEKYPEAGLEAETEIAQTLRDMADIIQDKK